MKIFTRLLSCVTLFILMVNGLNAQTPVNDVCANAILLTSSITCTPTAGTTEGATDNNEPGECTIGIERSVWFRFVATGPAQTVAVDGVPGFDAVVGVFNSCGGTAPAGGGCTDATASGGVETLSLTGLTPGATYFIQVYELFGEVDANSDFTICVFGMPLLPVNDACANAILLTPNITCTPIAGTTQNATDENVPGECSIGTANNSVWYKFVAISSRQTITVDGVAGFDAVVGVFASCGGTSPVGGGCTNSTGDDIAETLQLTGLTVGNTYYIQVYDLQGDMSAAADFDICLYGVPNDVCADAILLTSGTTCVPAAGTTEGAVDNNEAGECTIGFERSVWFRFVATGPAQTITVDGTPGFDAVVGVFSGCGGTAPAGGSCTDATASGGVETLSLTGLTAGSTYYIQVYELFGEVTADSDFTICVFGASILPIELSVFNGEVKTNINVLHWETLTEKNVQFHIVERSADGQDWREIGRKNGLINSVLPVKYRFEDSRPFAKAYYRLRFVDVDGRTTYSNTILLAHYGGLFGIVSIFPSPAEGHVTVRYNARRAEKVTLQIMDMAGRLVASQTRQAMKDRNEWLLTVDGLPAGTYSVVVKNSTSAVAPVRFIKK